MTADGGGQGEGDPEALVEPEPGEIGGEPARAGADPEIGGQRQAEPSTDGRPLDGDHQGQRPVDQPGGGGVEAASASGSGRPAAPKSSPAQKWRPSEQRTTDPAPRWAAAQSTASTTPDQQRGVEEVGRRTVHLHLGHLLGRRRLTVTSANASVATASGHRSLLVGVGGGHRATSVRTSSLCSPLTAAWRRTVGPGWLEKRTGWGMTL